MARYDLDPERTQLSVGTRPGLPGLGARVSGVRGSFEATHTAAGSVDLGAPITGELTAIVDGIETGNQLVADAVARWSGASSGLTVQVTISAVRPVGDDDAGRVEVVLHAVAGERAADLVGSGRVRALEGGAIEAAGVTLCDPRAFGISLPPLLNLIVHVRWRLTLVPK